MATFSTKFIKGEQVYYIDEFYHDRTCSYCSGTGEITLVRNNKVKTVRCPVCKGFGLENKSKWKVSNCSLSGGCTGAGAPMPSPLGKVARRNAVTEEVKNLPFF